LNWKMGDKVWSLMGIDSSIIYFREMVPWLGKPGKERDDSAVLVGLGEVT